MLEIRDLHKTYQKNQQQIQVLKGINLKLSTREAIAIVGASGVGKSTLLNLIGALDTPSKGQILFEGTDINQMNHRNKSHFRNKSIGFIFQFHHLMPEFTALENTMMPGLIAGMKKDEIEFKAQELLLDVGLKERMGHKPGELSGGEQQRVALARAIVMMPSLILADEPTGNLDSNTGKKMHDLLLNLNQKYDMTLINVTHNQELASTMPSQFQLLNGDLVEI